MKIKFTAVFFLLFASCYLNAQDSIVFKNFTLLQFSYSAAKTIPSSDSFLTKQFTLANEEGDSLILFQKLPFQMVNGEVKVFDMGLTDQFIHLRKNSSYTIIFSKDKFGLLKNREYLSHRKIDFLYQNTKGAQLSSSDKSNPLILLSIIKISKPPLGKKVAYLDALDSLHLIRGGSDQRSDRAVSAREVGIKQGKMTFYTDSNILIYRDNVGTRMDKEEYKPRPFHVKLPKGILWYEMTNSESFAFYYKKGQTVLIQVDLSNSNSGQDTSYIPAESEIASFVNSFPTDTRNKFNIQNSSLMPGRKQLIVRKNGATILLYNIIPRNDSVFTTYLKQFKFI
jgi:hypothetical protein